jgi:site-specific recombinase XerD
MSGARLATLFLDMLAAERGASRNTLDAYRRDLEDYLAYLKEAGARADGAGAAVVRGFMASLEERGLKASSAARRLSAVRQFHKFLYVEGYASADPTAAVAAPKRGRAHRRFSRSMRSTGCWPYPGRPPSGQRHRAKPCVPPAWPAFSNCSTRRACVSPS